MNTLHIFTAAARPQLLHGLLTSIYTANPNQFNIKWYVSLKGAHPDPGGQRAFNDFLERLPKTDKDWILMMCDDNLVHAKLLSTTSELIEANPSKKCFVFGQERHDNPLGRIHAVPQGIKPGYVDGGQVIIRTDLIGDTRIANSPMSDGIFIKALYDKEKDSFFFLDEILCYHEAAYWFVGGGEKSDRYWHRRILENTAQVFSNKKYTGL